MKDFSRRHSHLNLLQAQVFLLVFALATMLVPIAFAQTASLNCPESVAWDAGTRTYLISSACNGSIVRRNANGTFSPFASTGLESSKGLAIAKFGTTDALWVADSKSLKAFNLITGAQLGAFTVPNAVDINDIAVDSTAGILYISDPAAGIFRAAVSVSGSAAQVNFTTLVSGAEVQTPNGLCFDRANNRLIAVSFTPGAAQIYGINLRTTPPTVQTLATTPSSSGLLDGIARDKQGRYYVSSWDANNVTRYDSTVTSPTVIASGFDGPADILFNATTDTLVVPNFTRNTLDFIRIQPAVVSNVHIPDAPTFALKLAPNPANEQSLLSYTLPRAANVTITVLNILGETMMTLETSHQAAGLHHTIIPLSPTLTSGVYYCRIQADNATAVLRLTVVR